LGGFAKSTRNNGYAPLIIKGPISSGKIELDGEDSQPVSALLMMASFVEGITEIYVKNPGEKPWIDLTLSWLDRLGVSYNYRNHEFYRIEGKQQRSSFELSIPGDLSSAAFPIAAAILTQSEITLHHVNMDDVQGDKQLIYLLQQMGANLYIDKNNQMLKVKPGSSLVGMMIDVNPFIDALPILAVLACFAKGETRLVNGAIARKKESNRLASITNELKKMGANIEETEDGLRISQSCLHGAQVNSYADHRIAMALIVAGLASDGVTEVIGIECIKKSFPNFIEDFQKMGAKIEGNYGF
jgi:3-phosphoshikimate 1-carboxyvinyltransferase